MQRNLTNPFLPVVVADPSIRGGGGGQGDDYIVTIAMNTLVPYINIGRTECLLFIITCLLIT